MLHKSISFIEIQIPKRAGWAGTCQKKLIKKKISKYLGQHGVMTFMDLQPYLESGLNSFGHGSNICAMNCSFLGTFFLLVFKYSHIYFFQIVTLPKNTEISHIYTIFFSQNFQGKKSPVMTHEALSKITIFVCGSLP